VIINNSYRNGEATRKQMIVDLETKKNNKLAVEKTQEAVQNSILELQAKQRQLLLDIDGNKGENTNTSNNLLVQNNIINEKKQQKVELTTRKSQIEIEKAKLLSAIEMNKNAKKQLSDELKALDGKKNNLSKEYSALLPVLEDAKKKRIQAEQNGAQLEEAFTNFVAQVWKLYYYIILLYYIIYYYSIILLVR
jgi:chromosome segregation ATPase